MVSTKLLEGTVLKQNDTDSTKYCVKRVRVRSFSGPYFPAFGLNTEIHSVSLRIHSKYGKIQIRKTPNTDTFHAVNVFNNKISKI